MNKDVFLSILAMDSYNRGYNQGVSGLSDTGGIGNATIDRQSNIRDGSTEIAAGFYAIAYDWNGQKVISYRGTDPSHFPLLLQDLAHGWSSFTGLGDNSQFGLR